MNRFFAALSLLITLTLACAVPSLDAISKDPPVPSGSVLFQDDFSQPLSGFNHFMTAEGIMDYDSGGYRILVNGLQTNFWATPRKNFADVRMEVDTGKLGGPDENRIGLLCRYVDNNYYFFLISSDGYYGIGVYYTGQAILLGQSEMQPHDSIKQGLAVNHLRADCVGNTLSLYVNGYLVAAAQNDVLTSGDVGLLAGSFSQSGVDVVFDNFVVLKP